VHSIGSYNEFYITCTLRAGNYSHIELQSVVLNTSAAFAPRPEFHIEMELVLNSSEDTSVHMVNSTIYASSVRLQAAIVSIDARSHVNVTANGLRFGPGFNSFLNMGGSYGGIGGVSLDGDVHRCDHVDRNRFYKPLGDVVTWWRSDRGPCAPRAVVEWLAACEWRASSSRVV
jgi:hypothetical protein